MEYTHLGRSGLQISRIGFGCMSLKRDTKEQEKLIGEAIDKGINYFDTADLYEKGANESLLGRAIKGRRQNLVIATKVGNQWKEDGSGWVWNPRKSYILQAVEHSLKRLQLDHIDLYQLHGGTIEDPFDETIEAFEQLVDQGKIRYYGISSIRPNVIRKWTEHSQMVSVMMQYSLLDRRPEEAILPLLEQSGIGVLARGSVAQGLLVNKPAKSYLNYSEDQVRAAANGVHSLVDEQRNEAGIAIGYVLHHPAISSAVVGIRTSEQLNEAIAASGTQLSPYEIEFLRRQVPVNHYTEHR